MDSERFVNVVDSGGRVGVINIRHIVLVQERDKDWLVVLDGKDANVVLNATEAEKLIKRLNTGRPVTMGAIPLE